MTPNEILMCNAAEHLACWLHRDQVDLQGEPYVGHLARVAGYVLNHGGTSEQIAAAWLHDAIEDRTISLAALREIFPDTVALAVHQIARQRGEETYAEYTERLCASTEPEAHSVLLVKLADLEDNIARGQGHPEFASLVERYERALPRVLKALDKLTNSPAPAGSTPAAPGEGGDKERNEC